jgi:1-phosphofructokinase family hexose kinase
MIYVDISYGTYLRNRYISIGICYLWLWIGIDRYQPLVRTGQGITIRLLILNLNPSYDHWILIDEPPVLDHVLRGKPVTKQIDGKGLNIARVLKTLGTNNFLCLNVLGGSTGAIVHSVCHDLQIPSETFWIEEETRINTAVVHKHSGESRVQMINETGPTMSRREVSALKKRAHSLIRAGDLVVISGSAVVGFGPGDMLELAKTASDRGAKLSVDIAADWLEAIVQMKIKTLKINNDEFRLAFGFDPLYFELLVSFWQKHQIEELIVTFGAQGALSVSRQGVFRAHGEIAVENLAVGSGDSFFAGYLSGLQSGDSVQDRLVLSTACGIANARHYGAGLMSLEDIEKASVSVTVEEVSNVAIPRN